MLPESYKIILTAKFLCSEDSLRIIAKIFEKQAPRYNTHVEAYDIGPKTIEFMVNPDGLPYVREFASANRFSLRIEPEPILESTYLLSVCNDPAVDYITRAEAACALGRRGDLRAVEPLCAAISTDNYPLVLEAATILATLNDGRAAFPLIQSAAANYGRQGSSRIYLAITSLGEPALQALLAAALSPAESIRAVVFDILRIAVQNGSPWGAGERLATAALQGLDDPAETVRCSAVNLSGALALAAAVDPLIALTKDKSSDVRWCAALALGKIGDERALPALQWMVEHDTGTAWQRQISANAAGAIRQITQK